MKNRLFATLLLAVLAVMANAQTKTDPKRIAAIWDSAYERMSQQDDIWFESGDYPRIVAQLRYMHELWPDDYETATDLGWMMENIDRWDEALALYVGFRKGHPNLAGSAFPEANFYFTKKLYSKVPPLLEPMITAKKMTANSFRLLAHAYERLNLLKDAERTWSLYISLRPEDLAAKQNLERIKKKLSSS